MVGDLRVAAYRALGLLPDGSEYAQTLRRLGFDDDGDHCAVLVAVGEAGNGAGNEAGNGAGNRVLGTVTLESFEPGSELARDYTEADIRAFAVAPYAQGQGVGRTLLLAVIERAEKRGLRQLRLCTQPEMRAAQHLYTTTGFTRTPDLDWEPRPGVILRAYELPLPL